MPNLIKNILYNSTYQILLILLPLITTPYISRVLGAANIGIYAYYFTFAAYFVMFSKLGVANYGSRSIAEASDSKESLSQTFSEIYGVQFFSSSIAILAYIILFFFQTNPQVYLCAGLYVLSGILDISWLYFGLEEFKKTALRSIAVKVLSVILLFVIVRDETDILPYTIICCGTHFVTNIILWLMLPSVKIKLQFRFFKNSFKHLKSLLILFLPVIGISLYNYMDKLMLGNMSNMNELGFYQSSESIMFVPVSLITAIGTVMLPRMSHLYQENQTKDTSRYIMISMWLSVFVVSAFAFGIIGVSPEFVPVFYGSGFDRCIILLRILMVATLFVGMANVIRTQILLPQKMDKIYVLSIFCGAGINLILNYLLIPKHAAVGASIATVMAECLVFLVQAIYCNKKEPVLRFIVHSIPFVCIGVAMAILLSFLTISPSLIQSLIVKIATGSIFYLVLSGVYYKFVLNKVINSK